MANFCTKDDVEDLLQISISTQDEIDSCTRAIKEATAVIKNYCHQYLEKVEDEEYIFDVLPGRTMLFLPELPVISVKSVIEDGEMLTEGSDEDYQLGRNGILYRVGQKWASGVQIVPVIYTHGYETIPEEIKDICMRASSRVYQAGLRAKEQNGVMGVASLALGDYNVSFGSESGGGIGEGVMGVSAARMLLMSEKDILDKYRYMPA
jgi:hypothetical protein